MFKIGDIVRGDSGYTFDPVEGVIVDLNPIKDNKVRIKIKVIKHRHYIGGIKLWNYNRENLEIIASGHQERLNYLYRRKSD